MATHLATQFAAIHRALRKGTGGGLPRSDPRPAPRQTAAGAALLAALVGGLAASIFSQWYQTYHEKKVWLRQQYVLSLQESLDRALQANTVMEEAFADSHKVDDAIGDDERSAASARRIIARSRAGNSSAALVKEIDEFRLTNRVRGVLDGLAIQEAKLVMLIFQAQIPDMTRRRGKGEEASDALTAFKDWSNASSKRALALIRARRDGTDARLQDARVATATNAEAEEHLREAVRSLCQRAASRLILFRKYEAGLEGDAEPRSPLLPWF